MRSGASVPVPEDLCANTGDLIDIVCHVARVAAATGERLRAGQFVIAGSLVAPLLLEADADDCVSFRLGLDEVFVKFKRGTRRQD
jgi:2-keto-4-pentenoate hydratase